MIVHPAAQREIERSADWYAKRSSEVLARRFRHAVADALEAVSLAPHRFPQAHDDATMSQAWVTDFPFGCGSIAAG